MLQICAEFGRQRRGLPFRLQQVEGGRQGVSYGAEVRKVHRLDAMLFDVSLPPITILHLSAPSARLVLRVRLG